MSALKKQSRGSTPILAIAILVFGWLVVAGLAFFGDEFLRTYLARPSPAPVSQPAGAPPASTQTAPNPPPTKTNITVAPKAEALAAPAAIIPTVIAPPPLRLEIKTVRPSSLLTSAGVITWTNLQREQNGLPPLLQQSQLDQAARLKLDDMFQKQYFAHESPTGEGPGEVVAKAGFAYLTVGENLALGDFANDEDLVNGWMNSPGHRANILHQTFTHIGVAAGKGMYEGRETWMAVQEFGVPKSACAEPDNNLRQTIDVLAIDLAARQQALDQHQAEIQAMNPRSDPDVYNAKVDEFNALVAEFNALVAEQKQIVSRYNEQANGFNACVARYTST